MYAERKRDGQAKECPPRAGHLCRLRQENVKQKHTFVHSESQTKKAHLCTVMVDIVMMCIDLLLTSALR